MLHERLALQRLALLLLALLLLPALRRHNPLERRVDGAVRGAWQGGTERRRAGLPWLQRRRLLGRRPRAAARGVRRAAGAACRAAAAAGAAAAPAAGATAALRQAAGDEQPGAAVSARQK